MRAFDIEYKYKCPKCGKEMDYLYGKLCCSTCGYQVAYRANVRDESVKPDWTKGSVVERKIKQRDQAETEPSQSASKQKRNIHNQIAIVLIVIIVLCAIPAFLLSQYAGSEIGVSYVYEDDSWGDTWDVIADAEDVAWEYEEIVYEEETVWETEESESLGDPEGYLWTDSQSEGMIQFIEKIFGKEYTKVTREELEKIIYFSIDTDYETDEILVTYGILTAAEPEYGEYFDLRMEPADFYDTDYSIFNKMHTLYADYGSIASLEGLEELCVLGTWMTPTEIKQYINPMQLISLTLYDLSDVTTLDGIGEFHNLTSLYIYAYTVENIDALAGLTGLERFGIYLGDNIKSFDVLHQLTNLERLSISSYVLDKLDFVATMPDLYTLNVYDAFDLPGSEWEYITKSKSIENLKLENCIIPCDAEIFFNDAKLEQLIMVDCATGLDVTKLKKNDNLQDIELTGTYVFPIKNGNVDFTKDSVMISEYITEITEKFPNLESAKY